MAFSELHILPCMSRCKNCSGKGVNGNMYIFLSTEQGEVCYISLPKLTGVQPTWVDVCWEEGNLEWLTIGTWGHYSLCLLLREMQHPYKSRRILMIKDIWEFDLLKNICQLWNFHGHGKGVCSPVPLSNSSREFRMRSHMLYRKQLMWEISLTNL